MPLITYEGLSENKKCVYQAFSQLYKVGDTPAAMGAYVSSLQIDADDDKAVHALAEKYGLTEIEMFLGESWNSEDYNLSANREHILTINGSASMIKDFKAFNEFVLKDTAKIKRIQDKYPHEVGHAIYCKTEKGTNAIDAWVDVQKIYKKPQRKQTPFPAPTLVVAYARARKD